MRVAIPALLVMLLLRVAPAPAADADTPAFRFALAELLAAEGRSIEALDELADLIEREPTEGYLRLEYARLLLRLGRVAEAAEAVEQARHLVGDEPAALRLQARVNLALAERDPEALSTAQATLESLRGSGEADPSSMMALARLYIADGQYAAAVDLLRELDRRQPGNSAVLSLMVEALGRAEAPAEAETTLTEVLAATPQFLRGRLLLARLLAERGARQEALAILAAAPPGQQDDPALLRARVIELYSVGDMEGALVALEQLLASEPESPQGRYLKGRILAAMGRNGEAEAELRAVAPRLPENLDVALSLVRVLERQRRLEEAREVLREIVSRLREAGREPERREAELQMAALEARGHDWQGVLAVTGSLLAEEDPPEEALLLQADALVELGQGQEALDLLAAVEPLTPSLAAKRSEVLFELGRKQEARTRLEAMARSDVLESRLAAAAAYQRLGRHEAAIPVLEGVRETTPTAGTLFRLGTAYERVGRRRQAEAVFEALLQKAPDFAPALNYLGYMWAERGENLRQALELIRRAVAQDPENGAYVDSLGWTHFRLGEYSAAQEYLERAARLVPDDGVILEHLGDLYLVVGSRERALESYRRAAAAAGDNRRQVQRKLRRLRQAR